ncbi:MAG: hypothetical protein RJA49_1200, partial [Actinomycetota bacterium]
MWQRVKMRRRTTRTLLFLVAATFGAVACTGSASNGSTTSASIPPASATVPGPTTTAPEDAIFTESLQCDPLDERACLLPWPNDAFSLPDPSTPTGRRLDIHHDATPLNAAGTPIDVTDQNRADGFSPGSAVLAFVPGLDVTASGIAPSTDIGASLAADAPVVLLDTVT